MRPRIFSHRRIANYPGLYARRFGSKSVVANKISLTLSTNVPKRTVIEQLNQHLVSSSSKLAQVWNEKNLDRGAAIFASRDFATWLEDEGFISSVLEGLFMPNTGGQAGSQDIDVLCAAVDGLTPERLSGEPQTGFSILYGSASNILPSLWEHNDFGSNADQERESSVSFLSNPLPKDTRSLEITLPLANTIFQNGKQSTLLASKWKKSQNGSLGRIMTQEKRSQVINPRAISADHTRPLLPLLPLTPPRKIVAGLGNIVRQVEVDGSVTPASKELESLVPKIFDIRSQRDASYTPGPIGVWCWVIPPHVVETQGLHNLKVFGATSSQSEAELSLDAMNVFSELLSSGCRLHKIMSGGGGWGLKQGLLSLDPETTYSPPDQDDIEMFIRAFHERDSPNPSGGLATPGSYIMFCVEPHYIGSEIESSQHMTPTTSIGVAPNNDEEITPMDTSNNVKIIDNHFGVVSKAGLFLKATELPHTIGISKTDESAEESQVFTTKVNLPRAFLVL
ncbi:hypothetical protein F5Y04DRAFT_241337 [Hypomontagnella monticulosa]|nr:hypothetical protein F5Y04DRAFT_241337 [Hypomontagnella monticulosa]